MYRHGLAALFLLTAVTDATAGRIYGTLQIDGRAMPEGREIYVSCPPAHNPDVIAHRPPSGAVRKYGRYTVQAPADGECSFAVRLQDGSLVHTPIISFGNPTRYNFVINRHGDGYVIEKQN